MLFDFTTILLSSSLLIKSTGKVCRCVTTYLTCNANWCSPISQNVINPQDVNTGSQFLRRCSDIIFFQGCFTMVWDMLSSSLVRENRHILPFPDRNNVAFLRSQHYELDHVPEQCRTCCTGASTYITPLGQQFTCSPPTAPPLDL